MPPQNPLFSDLIKLLQQVHSPEDISPELWNELKTITALLTYNVFAANPGSTHRQVIEDCKSHFNEYFEEMARHIPQ